MISGGTDSLACTTTDLLATSVITCSTPFIKKKIKIITNVNRTFVRFVRRKNHLVGIVYAKKIITKINRRKFLISIMCNQADEKKERTVATIRRKLDGTNRTQDANLPSIFSSIRLTADAHPSLCF
jgi:hypothetical protein